MCDIEDLKTYRGKDGPGMSTSQRRFLIDLPIDIIVSNFGSKAAFVVESRMYKKVEKKRSVINSLAISSHGSFLSTNRDDNEPYLML